MEKEYRVDIENWSDVTYQFGIELAKKVSKNLKKEFDKNSSEDIPMHLEPHYDAEGYALFEFVYMTDEKVVYLFTGTAK